MYVLNRKPEKARPLNAISPTAPAEETRAAHRLAICAELAELGIALTRLAAKAATVQLSEPPPAEAPPAPAKAPDRAALFLRLANFTRQCVALQARLDRAPPRQAAPLQPPPAILAPEPEDGEEDPYEARMAACQDDETLLAFLTTELNAAARHLGVKTTGPP